MDLGTGALLSSGIALLALSAVAAMTLLGPAPTSAPSSAEPGPIASPPVIRPSTGLTLGQVATVLLVDASSGAGTAARSGDRVDVLGYFSRQAIGSESLTRVLLEDAPVLTVDRAGPGVALTLAVPHDAALLLQEAQAIGARPFVTLRAAAAGLPSPAAGASRNFSDTDLANRLAGIR